jgi:hypothetical protein
MDTAGFSLYSSYRTGECDCNCVQAFLMHGISCGVDEIPRVMPVAGDNGWE